MSEPVSTSPDIAPVDAIRIGERDRTDLGNLDELADSIKAVGLLHPVVVTADNELVAGGRRLAAVKQLGWPEVPVTVVDLTTAADVLRAELEENTCRKPLSPLEASYARERRAKALAPKIQENKGGRPKAESDIPQDGFWQEPEPEETSRKLREVLPKHARETAAVGAIGTGFSPRSIDKVDEVRQIAERGTRTVGAGKERREEPVPEPVREIARKQLPALAQTGAAIEPAHQAVRRALNEYVAEDPAVKDAKYWEGFTKALASVTTGFLTYDPERVATLGRDITGLEAVRGALATWFDTFDAACTGGTVTPLRRSS